MFKVALVSFVLAILTAGLGFTGFPAGLAFVGRALFYALLTIAVLAFVVGVIRRSSGHPGHGPSGATGSSR